MTVRGNRQRLHPAKHSRRSIPACAGEPGLTRTAAYKRAVYPRLCGGTAIRIGAYDMPNGLSPPVRENPGMLFFIIMRLRSIPACAGEPRDAVFHHHATAVYPHLCGGTEVNYPSDGNDAGLSPPVRGNRCPAAGGTWGQRSIPACAGEPRRTSGNRHSGEVYPRVCGGTKRSSTRQSPPTGLSPRVWGNRGRGSYCGLSTASISACVGEPGRRAAGKSFPGVYPRVCGEPPARYPGAWHYGGLSPRVRGTKRSSTRQSPPTGLSPRVRGNPVELQVDLRRQGSIPACAA